MRREFEYPGGKVIMWDAVEIDGGALLITLRPFLRDQAASENELRAAVYLAEKEGFSAYHNRAWRCRSPYKHSRGRIIEGMRPLHLAWLKGWDAALAQSLRETTKAHRERGRAMKAKSA